MKKDITCEFRQISHFLDRPRFRWLLSIVVTTGLIAIYATYGVIRFGSIPAALQYAGGQRLLIDATSKSLGEVNPGVASKLNFTLRNMSSHSIKIQGAQSSCTCAVINDLPCIIAPGDSRVIVLKIAVPDGRTLINGNISVFTDDPDTSVIVLGYRGRVVVPKSVGSRAVPG